MMLEYWAAFSLGLFGSLHCLGMCGPIAMALPLNTKEKMEVFSQSFLYNIGRVSSYAFMGLFMGLMGWGLVLTGYQKIISIGFGICLILVGLFSFSVEKKILQSKTINKLLKILKTKLGELLSIKNKSTAFKIGVLNGFLPCGMVYIALAGAILTGSVLSGAIYMILFGTGTLPMMVGVMFLSNQNRALFRRLQMWLPLIYIIFGMVLIFRGVAVEWS